MLDVLQAVLVGPVKDMVSTPAFLAEVIIGGLAAGLMYSLVALGFVLIYKASGVFNFAQGVMVLFAALTLVGLMERGAPLVLALLVTMAVMGAVTTLARRSQPGWRGLSNDEVLRELNLVSNPGHLYLHGPWRLVDEAGQVITLGEFHPSVGIPAAQAARLKRVTVDTSPIICVENPTSFYELTCATQHAALCLWGNPSPPCRHLLGCLPEEASFQVWADIDYGGLNILAQLREQVNPRAAPYRMDVETLEAHARWARPLTPRDRKNLTRLARRLSLADMRPLVTYMLRRGLKLEQEAVTPRAAPVFEKLRPAQL